MEKRELNQLTDVERKLIDEAIEVRKNAFAPYSNFKVGAALVDSKGEIHTGCNVESSDYTLTTHAEMSAINDMVKCGDLQLKEIAIVLESDSGYAIPCGLCRQKIREFSGNENVKIFAVNINKDNTIKAIHETSLKELYPFPFGQDVIGD